MKLTPNQIKKIQKIGSRYLNFLYEEVLPQKKGSTFQFWLNKDIQITIFFDGEKWLARAVDDNLKMFDIDL